MDLEHELKFEESREHAVDKSQFLIIQFVLISRIN